MHLRDIPAGSQVFIDANIFFYQIIKHPSFWRSCEAFLERIKTGDLQGFTSVVVLNELLYKLILAEVAQREAIPDYQAHGSIKANPKALEQLAAYASLDTLGAVPNLRVLEVQAGDFTKSRELMKKHRLFPNDALHLAVMQRQGIDQLASNDRAFRPLKDIKVYWP